MKLLVLGGTAFLSRTVAENAVRRGHEVTCACRGRSGPLPDGVRHVPWDRNDPAPADLGDHDAVVDVSRIPSHVRRAVDVLPDAHWVFVSTCSVYADQSRRGSTADQLPLLEPVFTDEDPMSAPEVYGAMKVACEQVVTAAASSAMVVRAGLIVGPGDPSGRFSYWPNRIAAGGEVLAPESPDDPVQLVDVRDLAQWLVDSAEARRTGVFDGISEPFARRDLLAQVAAGTGADVTFTWVPRDFLVEHEVAEWAGPRSLPLWLSDPEWDGFLAHDTSPAMAAGLRIRPVAESARDTLAWLRATPDAEVTGLTPQEEAGLLAAWHQASAGRRSTRDPPPSAAEGQGR